MPSSVSAEALSDDAKREKYDNDKAKKRAEELIRNVTVKTEELKEEKIPLYAKLCSPKIPIIAN